MTGLTQRLQEAATAAIADVMPAIEAEPRKVRPVTIERAVNVNRLLTSGGPRP